MADFKPTIINDHGNEATLWHEGGRYTVEQRVPVSPTQVFWADYVQTELEAQCLLHEDPLQGAHWHLSA